MLKSWSKIDEFLKNLRDSSDQWTESSYRKSLVDGESDLWTASASGVEEYYYINDIKPATVLENDSLMTEGTLGSLNEGEWAFGDNDSLGYETVYVRLNDSTDPDGKSANYIEVKNKIFYFNGTIDSKPLKVEINGEEADLPSDISSMQTERWFWGNEDSLGSNTVYVRLTDGEDPDVKEEGYIMADVEEYYTILQPAEGNTIITLAILLSNYSDEKDVNVRIIHTDSSDAVKFKWWITILAASSPFALDSKLVFANEDKLKVSATIDQFSVYVSGDEQ